MNNFGATLDLEFDRIRKSLGLDSKAAWRNDLNEFLGRAPSAVGTLEKLPRYSPFFPMDAIGAYRHISEGHSSPGREKEKDLIQAFQTAPEGSVAQRAAFNQLVKAFVRLIMHRSRQFLNSGVPQEDIVQECMFGLLRAAEKADMTLGNRFSTYAANWIDQTAGRIVANESRIIRIPVHGHVVIRRTKAIQRDDFLHGRRFRGLPKVESELAIAPGSLQRLMEADVMTLSLQTWSKSGDLPDPFDLEGHIQAVELRKDLNMAIELLRPREAGVLKMRYGLISGDPMTLGEIGGELGITREAIRQIEKKARENLLKGPLANKLRAHADLDSVGEPIQPNPPKAAGDKKRKPISAPRKRDSNEKRTLAAASLVIAQVERVFESLGENVPETLRSVGELRLKYRDASLGDLGKLSNPPISKDAYAGRLRRLLLAAEKSPIESYFQDSSIAEPQSADVDPPEKEPEEVLTVEGWREIGRKAELAIQISGGRLSDSEKQESEWVLSRLSMAPEEVLRDAGGLFELKSKLRELRFLIGDPWS